MSLKSEGYPGELRIRSVYRLVHDGRGVLTDERESPGRYLEQAHAEGEDVQPAILRVEFDLLRRHEMGRAGQDVRQGDPGVVQELGQAEIQDLDLVFAGGFLLHHDVLQGQVAMQETLLVGVAHGVTNLDSQGHHFLDGKFLVAGQVVEGSSVNQLHDEARLVVGLAEGIDGHDAGMVHVGHRFALLAEPGFERRIGRTVFEHLDGHRPLQVKVEPLVDQGEPAFTQQFVDPVFFVDDAPDHSLVPSLRNVCSQMLVWPEVTSISVEKVAKAGFRSSTV